MEEKEVDEMIRRKKKQEGKREMTMTEFWEYVKTIQKGGERGARRSERAVGKGISWHRKRRYGE